MIQEACFGAALLLSSIVLLGQSPASGAGQVAAGSSSGSPATSSAVAGAAQKENTLANEDIIRLSRVGLEPDVIITKIQTAPKVDFKLGTEDLIELKDAGVNQEVIRAMMTRANNPSPTNAGSGPEPVGGQRNLPRVTSVPGIDDIPVEIEWSENGRTRKQALQLLQSDSLSTVSAPFVAMLYANFNGLSARVRVSSTTPTLLLRTANSPVGQYLIVKADRDSGKDVRSVKLERVHVGRTLFAPSFSTKPQPLKVDEDWTVDYEARQVQPGEWEVVPKKPLKAGEYGLWVVSPIAAMYDFEVGSQ